MTNWIDIVGIISAVLGILAAIPILRYPLRLAQARIRYVRNRNRSAWEVRQTLTCQHSFRQAQAVPRLRQRAIEESRAIIDGFIERYGLPEHIRMRFEAHQRYVQRALSSSSPLDLIASLGL